MSYAIDQCKLRAQITSEGMSKEDLMEAVMERAGVLVTEAQEGGSSKPHKLPGIELMARAVTNHLISEGARVVAGEFGLDMDDLKKHAASAHISSC